MPPLRKPLVPLTLAILVLMAVSVLAIPVTAADLPFGNSPSVDVTGSGRVQVGELMPGDTLQAQSIEITANQPMVYGVRPRVTGSDVLARALHVKISSAGGVVLYDGALDGAAVSGETRAGAPQTLALQLSLPVSAGNEVQGTDLDLEWVVTTTEQVAVATS